MAAVDFFLKIDGIPGESQDAKHKDEIQVDSWSLSERQSGTMADGGGGGAGKVKMNDVSFSEKLSKASPKLWLVCATGEHIKKAVLTARKAGKDQHDYLTITLTDLLISSYQTGGSGSAKVPIESITLNFAAIQFEYKEQKADGKVGASVRTAYDLKRMTAS
jgi:type VI secretion system secreted protein Hcp